MYENTLLSILTLREVGTVFLGMHKWTLLISVIAIGPMSASDLLLVS
jgi:hypothetical protein